MANISKRAVGGQPRYDVNYREPDGRQRRRTFRRKIDADKFAASVETDKWRGVYIDPDAGQVLFKNYAEQWIKDQYGPDQRTTRDMVELRMRLHVFPTLGRLRLAEIRVTPLRSWAAALKRTVKSPAYRHAIAGHVSAILATAVEEDRITKNYMRAKSVRDALDTVGTVNTVREFWEPERVAAVRDRLPERWRVVVDLGAGLGLRQGEIFGLSPDDVDFLRGTVTLRRQVKVFAGNRLAFGPLKHRAPHESREIPLPGSVRDLLAAHLARWPAKPVTLPFGDPDNQEAERVTVPLILTSRESKALNRNHFNSYVWKRALRQAGVPDTRENGTHALRHHYASVLLDAGESIKAIAEYLGHGDAGFTLRVYAHRMKSSTERTRQAVDQAFARYMSGTSADHMSAETGAD